MVIRRIILAASMMTLLIPMEAWSSTDCRSTVSRVWVGDDATWIHMSNNGSAIIANTDPKREALLSMAMTALASFKPVSIRYAADEVECSTRGRTDAIGMQILSM